MRAFLLHCSIAALGVLALPALHAQTFAPPPVEAFFDNPAFSAAVLSPSGKYLAARVSGNGSRERLAVYDIETGKAQIVAVFADADVDDFQWVSDERLIYDLADRDQGQGQRRYAPGLFAVNRDASQFRRLAEREHVVISDGSMQKILPWHTYMLPQVGKQDSEFVYVESIEFSGLSEVVHRTLLRLNTLNGRTTEYQGPGNVKRWLTDYAGEPRIAVTAAEGTSTVYYRDPKKNNEWRSLGEFGRYIGTDGSFSPLAFGPDGKLYVLTSRGDKTAVYSLDLDTARISDKPVVVQEDFDFSGELVFSEKGMLGIRSIGDTEATQWVDKDLQAAQAYIDRVLPATVNVLMPPRHPSTHNMLVKSYSDRQPPIYYVYRGDVKKLVLVGSMHPQIKPAAMGKRDLVRYKARDGLTIPAWVTLPANGKKNAPMVVLVHGGPWVRGDTWAFNAEAQFLASRGYFVLQPEFRGSTGYGNALFKAGWKQWGLKMQDDIADGARWAIAQGHADPKRICIAGASYGGYATLMGLVNDPDLYKCGINWAGVTDIDLMYSGAWYRDSDLSAAWKKYGMPALIGDQQKDAEQLKRTSPLLQAAKIRQPLLLAYGGADQRVPIFHGQRFYDAVRPYNSRVEWLEYTEEGHGWVLPKNRFDFWTRVEKFLDQNIGAGAKTE